MSGAELWPPPPTDEHEWRARKKNIDPEAARWHGESYLRELEVNLHRLGYRYTGPGNLYDLTLLEVRHLMRGQQLAQVRASGTPVSHLRRAEQLEAARRKGM